MARPESLVSYRGVQKVTVGNFRIENLNAINIPNEYYLSNVGK